MVNFIEESSIQDLADMDILWKNKFQPNIDKYLSDKSVENKLVAYISTYRDRYIRVLASPMVIHNMPFGPRDRDIIFNTVNISRDEVEELMKCVDPKTPNGKMPENVEAFTIIMLLILGYYKNRKDDRMYNIVSMYYAYSRFFSLYTKYFPVGIRETTMEAATNEMSNLYYIKKTGSLEGSLRLTMATAIETYTDRLIRGNDSDIIYVILNIKNRLNGLMKQIKNIYEETNTKGDVVIKAATFDEESNILDLKTNSSHVDSYANDAVHQFISNDINMKTAANCANWNSVSVAELRSALNILKASGNIKDMRDFYLSIFYLFFNLGNDTKDIKSLKFLAVMDGVYKKGNSNDKNIILIKKLLDKWLQDGSSTYRMSNHNGTKNNFRRAIFWYLIKIVSES